MVFKNLVGYSESGGRMGASESGIVPDGTINDRNL